MLGIFVLFLHKFFKIKALIGGLSGAVVVLVVNLLDMFAYFESLAASRDFTLNTLAAVLPITGIYLIFGRAFCGWVCPMDFMYEMVDRVKVRSQKLEVSSQDQDRKGLSLSIGYVIAAILLIASSLLGIPFFTNYLSHLTNFFRMITSVVFLALNLPVDSVVLAYSGGIILLLLIFEFFFPRLWCRVLCPVGMTYGLLNKVSLIKLKFLGGVCSECNLCEHTCYMGVKIVRHIDKPGLRDINCIYCNRCAEGCETKGRLIKLSLWR
mgnify:FL=1